MSLYLNLGTEPNNLRVKSLGLHPGGIWIGDYNISDLDFCEVIKYYLSNSDLLPNDPRIDLVTKLHECRIVPGYNENGIRIEV